MHVISKYNIMRSCNQVTNFNTTWQNFSRMQTMPDNGYWLDWLMSSQLPLTEYVTYSKVFCLCTWKHLHAWRLAFVNGKDLPPLAYEPSSTIQIKNLLYFMLWRPACVGLSWFWGLHTEATSVLESMTLKLGEALGHKALCLDSALLKLLRKCIYLVFFYSFSQVSNWILSTTLCHQFLFFWLLIFATLGKIFWRKKFLSQITCFFDQTISKKGKKKINQNCHNCLQYERVLKIFYFCILNIAKSG
jgi:hypothetical protein